MGDSERGRLFVDGVWERVMGAARPAARETPDFKTPDIRLDTGAKLNGLPVAYLIGRATEWG